MFDIVIRNARVCDGSGSPIFNGSVAVRDGRIVAIGEVEGPAKEIVDAGGLVLAPGFIDQHTHFDAQLLWDRLAEPSLEHGVTTVVTGNCSLSLAPVKPEHHDYLGGTFRKIEEMPAEAMDAGVKWNWQTFDDYLKLIKQDLGINVAPVVGHSLLRLWVMGFDARSRRATPAEIAGMQELLRECFKAGAVAMSTSWVDVDVDNRPVPCRLGEPDELDALCAVISEFGGTLQVVPEFFLADMLMVRIDILADLSRKHGITCTFSPIFDSEAYPENVSMAVERSRLQSANGARVIPQMQVRSIDIAFELNATSSLVSTMPRWWAMLAAGRDATKAALRDPEQRKQLVEDALNVVPPLGLKLDFNEAIVKRAMLPEHQPLLGRKLKDIAAELGTTSVDVMIDIALAEDLNASFGLEDLAHDNADKIGRYLADKHVAIGAADGGAHLARFATYGDTGLLFSRYVRSGLIPIEEAVRKLTSPGAQVWGLKNRGEIKVGYAADLVLFDDQTIDRGPEIVVHDLPGGKGFRYLRRASGVSKVWVNGALTYDGETGYSGKRCGTIAAGGAGSIPAAPGRSPEPLRRWVYPQSSDSWEKMAQRTLPDLPVDEAVSQLQSWNLYLAYRLAPAEITPQDILFIEPPVAA